jgi:uncharacterized repeat protein (TIGR03803 family)
LGNETMNFTLIGRLALRIAHGAVAALALTLFASLAATRPAFAQTESVLYSFCSAANCADGVGPDGGLIADSAGNLYGLTFLGGAANGGVVFKLTPTGEESVLYSFFTAPGGYDAEGQLTMDEQGNLYGTTGKGGSNRRSVQGGDGTVFKLTPDGTETTLYNFGATSADGIEPVSGLVMDGNGNLYGTTYLGGMYGVGTVFRVTPEGVETVLHTFVNNETDGSFPWAALILDNDGNLYGTTRQTGGSRSLYGGGTVFEVTAEGSYKILHTFAGYPSDGSFPTASLTLDSQGNLYGATYSGGALGEGTVFKLTPGSNGSWNETILYNFNRQAASCQGPYSNLVFDAKGNLYGTTFYGGAWGNGCIYKISPAGKLTIVHAFGEEPDGAWPFDNLLSSQDNLYGVTEIGGQNSGGTVFKFTP